MDLFQVIRPLRLVGALQREVAHADDRVHRRADLVRHVGEELALGEVGGLGRFAGGLQLHLVLLDLGNVLQQPERAGNVSLLVAEDDADLLDVPDFAVLAEHPVLDDMRAPAHDVGVGIGVTVPVLGM